MKEFLYENAPLVEVICEVRWALQEISAVPNGKIDPHFDIFRDDTIRLADQAGFSVRENLQTDRFPRELRPYAPEIRFRKKAGEWPVFQIGPGIFTVNITPPYRGWSNFKPIIQTCTEILLEAYPLSDRYLKVNRLELRYVDAFDKKFGFSSYMQFAPENISFFTNIPTDLIEKHVVNVDDIEIVSRVMMPIKSPKNARAIVGLNNGFKDSMSALVADFIIREDRQEPVHFILENIISWFDAAHISVGDIFNEFATEALKEMMRPQREVEVP